MDPFVYRSQAVRVVFGDGTLDRLGEEVDLLSIRRALVLTTAGHEAQGRALADRLKDRFAGVFPGAVMHTPLAVTEQALRFASEVKADGVIALGGGSTIGLGKAIGVRTGLPQIAIPTTYAGSEMTPILGETADGVKTTRSDPAIAPKTVIYDVALTLSLPPRLVAVSGLNAMAHAVEALYARDRNPVISLMAEEAIRAMATALPAVVSGPSDREARANALYGAWLCGLCLGSVGVALHHKLCHVLGGAFNLPHAETHAIVLPHALRYNAGAVPDAINRMTRIFAGRDPADSLYDLGRQMQIPASLREIGMPQDGIARAVDLTFANPYWNPRPLERGAIEALIAHAWAGEPPGN
ncbi:maleylacetate reductase [Bradyrhizobium sp. NP1]|uniref:maleylacetate reductase n=1 Tax=Bradyrhizobium sp. NP1 TaxID=3049772 RepID=UPI0025A4FE3A|nr:maleylacetate reductase [Bradyrhizobium sp. NP1]WJR80410.1 maleylacetate reductase [Bradyrhizobium sp. NP1]